MKKTQNHQTPRTLRNTSHFSNWEFCSIRTFWSVFPGLYHQFLSWRESFVYISQDTDMPTMFEQHSVLIYPDTICPVGNTSTCQPSHLETPGKYQQRLLVASMGYFLLVNDPASVFLVCALTEESVWQRVAEGRNYDWRGPPLLRRILGLYANKGLSRIFLE